jgi:hypothetical protein
MHPHKRYTIIGDKMKRIYFDQDKNKVRSVPPEAMVFVSEKQDPHWGTWQPNPDWWTGTFAPLLANLLHQHRTPKRIWQCHVCGGDYINVGGNYHLRAFCSNDCQRNKYNQTRQAQRAKFRPSRAREQITRDCEACGVEFNPARADAKYCSVKCRVAAHRAFKD